jgi:preprotein translocase subunit YajC
MKKWISTLPLLAMSAGLFAQEATDAAPAVDANSSWQTLMMVGIAVLFFYFILWRPEQKRRKAMEKQRSSLRKGDRVTAMGIVGTLVRVQPESPTVIVKMFDGSKIEMLKAAITEVHPATDEEASKAEKEDACCNKKTESITAKD